MSFLIKQLSNSQISVQKHKEQSATAYRIKDEIIDYLIQHGKSIFKALRNNYKKLYSLGLTESEDIIQTFYHLFSKTNHLSGVN